MTDKLQIVYESTPNTWCAYYDPEGIIGRGTDEVHAVADLLDQMDEDYRCQLDRAERERDTAIAHAAKLDAEAQKWADRCEKAEERLAEALGKNALGSLSSVQTGDNEALLHVVRKAAEWDPENTDCADLAALGAYARAALSGHQTGRSAPLECTPMPAGEDGWSEWTHPIEPYHMQCCDCGLVHEVEFRIVKEKVYKPDGSWDVVQFTSDPTLEVIFRMRRPEGHRAGVEPYPWIVREASGQCWGPFPSNEAAAAWAEKMKFDSCDFEDVMPPDGKPLVACHESGPVVIEDRGPILASNIILSADAEPAFDGFRVWDGDDFYAEASGQRESALAEAKHYASQCDSPRIEEVLVRPLSLHSQGVEPDWRKSWYCGRCDEDTPTNEDGKCPVCTKYKVLPSGLERLNQGLEP